MARSRCFVFTLNNYTAESLTVLDELDCRYMIYGKEVAPKTGTPHLQGYVAFPSQRTVSSVIKKLPGAHVAPAKGTGIQNRDYCIKEGDYTERGDMPLTPQDGPAAKAARNLLLMKTPIIDLLSQGEISLYSVGSIHKAKMIIAQELLPYNHDALRGQWYYGPPGSGKSRKAREDHPDAYLKAQNKWWDGYEGQTSVILDDMDTDCLGHYLKIWGDRYACTGEIKGGTVHLRHQTFIITSNFTIEELFKDKPLFIEAIKRRFHTTNFYLASPRYY